MGASTYLEIHVKRSTAIATALLAALATPVAVAENGSTFYVFAGGGGSIYDRANRDARVIDDVILTDVAYTSSQTNNENMVLGGKVGGGWRFADNFSAEISYLHFGKHSFHTTTTGTITVGRTAELEASAVGIGITGIFPITDQVDFTVRAGIARWKAEMTTYGALQPLTATLQAQAGIGALEENGTDFTLGIGLGIMLTDQLALTIDVDELKSSLAAGPSIPFTLVTTGVKYGF